MANGNTYIGWDLVANAYALNSAFFKTTLNLIVGLNVMTVKWFFGWARFL